jgi:hypothetical protein
VEHDINTVVSVMMMFYLDALKNKVELPLMSCRLFNLLQVSNNGWNWSIRTNVFRWWSSWSWFCFNLYCIPKIRLYNFSYRRWVILIKNWGMTHILSHSLLFYKIKVKLCSLYFQIVFFKTKNICVNKAQRQDNQ